MPFFALFATFTILILAAFSVRFNFVRRAEGDVHTPAIGLPSWNIRPESLISEYDPAVVLLLEIIVQRFSVIGSPKPELIDKLLPFPITCEVQKSASLFRRNEVNHILRQPITENLGKAGNRIPFTQFTLRCETRLPRRTRIDALRQSRRGTYLFRSFGLCLRGACRLKSDKQHHTENEGTHDSTAPDSKGCFKVAQATLSPSQLLVSL